MLDAPKANAVVGQSGGPTAVINASLVGIIEEANKHREEIELAAQITAGYSDGKDEPAVHVEMRRSDAPVEMITVNPQPKEEVQEMMI